MNFDIPKHLRAHWDEIVDKWYKGDEREAFVEAVTRFVEEEGKRIPKKHLFDSALSKVQNRQDKSEEILSDGLSSALDRMKKRKERGLPI